MLGDYFFFPSCHRFWAGLPVGAGIERSSLEDPGRGCSGVWFLRGIEEEMTEQETLTAEGPENRRVYAMCCA